MVQDYLSGQEAISFLGGLKYAYLFGAGLSVLAALFSFRQTKHTRKQAKPDSPNILV